MRERRNVMWKLGLGVFCAVLNLGMVAETTFAAEIGAGEYVEAGLADATEIMLLDEDTSEVEAGVQVEVPAEADEWYI